MNKETIPGRRTEAEILRIVPWEAYSDNGCLDESLDRFKADHPKAQPPIKDNGYF